jgi:hypothetical protein
MKKKAMGIVPDLIRKISNGEGISIKDVEDVKYKKIGASTLRAYLSSVQKKFYADDFKFDKSTNKWVVKEGRLGFLNEMLLKPEEAVILTYMSQNDTMCGERLALRLNLMINAYKKRTSLAVYKTNILEPIDDNMEKKFALIQKAITEKRKISFIHKNWGPWIFYPYKIVNIEYYWYLIGISEMDLEKDQIKYFAIYHISDIKLLDDKYEYNFNRIKLEKMDNAMNAYYNPEQEKKYVDLLVIDWMVEYIKRASFFSGWKPTGQQILVPTKDAEGNVMKDTDENEIVNMYYVYTVISTHKNYLDIIPILQKYIPYILVKEDTALLEAMTANLNIYLASHN